MVERISAGKEGAANGNHPMITTAHTATGKLGGNVGMTLVANVDKSVEDAIVANRYVVNKLVHTA